MSDPSRRDVISALAAVALSPLASAWPAAEGIPRAPRVRVRAITAGVTLSSASDMTHMDAALTMLARAKQAFEREGYVVQTVRVATQPLATIAGPASRSALLAELVALDAAANAHDANLSVGPILIDDRSDPGLASWAADVIAATRRTNLSIVVASPTRGVHARAAATAAATMLAIAKATPRGEGNFRFAAAANVPPGTPFFPVAYHGGSSDALAIGLESASLVEDAAHDAGDRVAGTRRLRETFNAELRPVERIARAVARRERRVYAGLDASPAPSLESSIGGAIEAFTGVPFGDASTLQACAMITAALKSLTIRTCGYSGLMLPVLEDQVLAKRAGEQRYGLHELLLYSSVCGTGLDVIPVPGDTSPETLHRLIGDVALLSARLQKPLSARLFPVPGKGAGEIASFEDPYLVRSCRIFPVA